MVLRTRSSDIRCWVRAADAALLPNGQRVVITPAASISGYAAYSVGPVLFSTKRCCFSLVHEMFVRKQEESG